MNLSRNRIALISKLFLLAGVSLAVGCSDAGSTSDSNEPAIGGEVTDRGDDAAAHSDAALERFALRAGLARNDLEIVGMTSTRYSALGLRHHEFKALNRRDGTIVGIALDDLDQEVDVDALRRDEEAASLATDRRAHPALAAALSEAKQDDLIDVAIWLKEEPSEAAPRPAAGSALADHEIEEQVANVRVQRAERVRAIVAPVSARLAQRGFELTGNDHAPLLHATLPAHVIEEMRGWEEIDKMYLPEPLEHAQHNESAAIYAPWVHSRGITGAGVRVGEIEVGGQINTANPFLAGITQDTTYSCLASHAAAVAGMIRSTDSWERGVSYDANLWIGGSCGGWPNELMNRTDAASAWGARTFNLSLGRQDSGVLSEMDRYYDSLVINQYRTVVIAAGNDGNAARVATPGTAFNVVTVGSFNEANGLMSGFSSGADPVSAHSDREKPEVAAPGEDFVGTINSSPWLGSVGSGTSYATPLVTGTTALMMQRNPSLQYWPEGVRAILMASAVHNIEGDTRLSELDGAGAIYSDYADDVITGVRGGWAGLGYDCSAAATITVGSMALTAGVQTRVVISWDTDPNYASYGTLPSADLDLVIKDAAGNYVTGSSSWDNTYEIVQFTPATTGTFTINVSKYRCDLSPRWLGFAYFR